MPRKLRQLRAEYRKLGFIENRHGGKGSHGKWTHPRLPSLTIVLSGHECGAKVWDSWVTGSAECVGQRGQARPDAGTRSAANAGCGGRPGAPHKGAPEQAPVW
jgi:predicted RNA binding protein YcfA (HicA-like mRNA interferase family)